MGKTGIDNEKFFAQEYVKAAMAAGRTEQEAWSLLLDKFQEYANLYERKQKAIAR